MSKESGMGSKRIGSMTSRGMGKCSAGSPAEQCGNAKRVSKGNKKWKPNVKGTSPFNKSESDFDIEED